MAAPDGRHGGIIGIDGVVTWYDLDAPVWQSPCSGGRVKRRSTVDTCNFEFTFRLEHARSCHQYQGIRRPACWWCRCRSASARSAPGGRGAARCCRQARGMSAWCPMWAGGSGASTATTGSVHAADLAALDHRTAALVAAGVDLRPVIAALDAMPDDTPLADVIGGHRKAQLTRLAGAGLDVLGDARVLAPRTAAYSDAPMRDLPEQIDLARAALGSSPAYHHRGSRGCGCRAATSRSTWTWRTPRTASPVGRPAFRRASTANRDGYYPFGTWEALTGDIEAEVFGRFWVWLTRAAPRCGRCSLVFRAYCYNAAANTQMRRIAAAAGLADEVAAFIGSGQWVDLLRVFGNQIVPPAGRPGSSRWPP